jgi:hypothetical protein
VINLFLAPTIWMNLFRFGPRTILLQRKFCIFSKQNKSHHQQLHSCLVQIFFSRGEIHYSKVYEMMTRLTPPVGFGKKCPKMVAYKVR